MPLVSPGVDKDEQKQRWKFVLEKFSHNAALASRKNPIPPEAEAQLLDIPELKKRRFTKSRKEGEYEMLVNKAEGGAVNVLDMTLEGPVSLLHVCMGNTFVDILLFRRMIV